MKISSFKREKEIFKIKTKVIHKVKFIGNSGDKNKKYVFKRGIEIDRFSSKSVWLWVNNYKKSKTEIVE